MKEENYPQIIKYLQLAIQISDQYAHIYQNFISIYEMLEKDKLSADLAEQEN